MKRTKKIILSILSCSGIVSIAEAISPQNDVVSGEQIFERATCAGCHPGGTNALHPDKPLKGPSFLARYKDDASIIKVVRAGVPNTGMPSFGKAQLSDRDLKLVIAYIRSLTPKAMTKATMTLDAASCRGAAPLRPSRAEQNVKMPGGGAMCAAGALKKKSKTAPGSK